MRIRGTDIRDERYVADRRMKMGTVVAVCTSPAKGTQKTDVKEAVFIEDFGIEGDCHAG